MSIKDEATDRVVRRYAKVHGLSYTRAIHRAVVDALRRDGIADEEEPGEPNFLVLARDVGAKTRALPTLDARSAEDIVGYDENGLPA